MIRRPKLITQHPKGTSTIETYKMASKAQSS